MQGFGQVQVEPDEPAFHHDWERRIFGLNFASLPINVDLFRFAVERIGAINYLTTSYYEHWLTALEMLAVERGVVSGDELVAAQTAATGGCRPPRRDDPERARQLLTAVMTPPSPIAQTPAATAFAPGDRVRVRAASPPGHTRCPRYVRGVLGVVATVHGAFALPDASVAGRAVAEPVYTVTFEAADLWGTGDHVVSVDLWESYLEPGVPDG